MFHGESLPSFLQNKSLIFRSVKALLLLDWLAFSNKAPFLPHINSLLESIFASSLLSKALPLGRLWPRTVMRATHQTLVLTPFSL